jgi:hypothetical protein
VETRAVTKAVGDFWLVNVPPATHTFEAGKPPSFTLVVNQEIILDFGSARAAGTGGEKWKSELESIRRTISI